MNDDPLSPWFLVIALGCVLFWIGVAVEWFSDTPLLVLIGVLK